METTVFLKFAVICLVLQSVLFTWAIIAFRHHAQRGRNGLINRSALVVALIALLVQSGFTFSLISGQSSSNPLLFQIWQYIGLAHCPVFFFWYGTQIRESRFAKKKHKQIILFNLGYWQYTLWDVIPLIVYCLQLLSMLKVYHEYVKQLI